MLRVIQVNRFNCGAENNAGTLQREAEMLRERQAVILSYVNFQKLFPVIVSIVDCGVIVLLLAADKPLEEFWSPLDSIRTPSDRKLWLNRAASSFFFFFGSCSFSSLSVHQHDDAACEEKTDAADRDRYQHLSVIICTCSSLNVSYLQQLTVLTVRGL